MRLIDTHAHLYHKQFNNDLDAMIARAKEAGIERVYLPNIDSAYIEPMLSLSKSNPDFCFPMMGVHPCSIAANYREELDIAQKWLFDSANQLAELADASVDKSAAKSSVAKSVNFCAVGEIGLDFHWSTEFVTEQKAAFQEQIDWAMELELPIVIHARKSLDDCIEMVEANPGLKGVFHCFGGTEAQARRALDTGFYLGIGGVVTYKNAGLAELMAVIGLDKVVLETDAPYLSPVPHRGKRNESSYIPIVASKLAEVCGISIEEVGEITTANALQLFPKS